MGTSLADQLTQLNSDYTSTLTALTQAITDETSAIGVALTALQGSSQGGSVPDSTVTAFIGNMQQALANLKSAVSAVVTETATVSATVAAPAAPNVSPTDTTATPPSA